jgi:hypothetical protein
MAKRPRQPIATRLSSLEADCKRVRAREEARLLRIARASGFFDIRLSSAEITSVFKALKDAKPNARLSQLKTLELTMATLKTRESADARRIDTRRKILLGAFLMAQIEHRPKEFAWVAQELEKFLDQHENPETAASNKALLSDYLAPAKKGTPNG